MGGRFQRQVGTATEADFIKADDPLHLSTVPMRTLADGTIVGFVRDTADLATKHEVVMSRGESVYHELPNSQHNGATPDGKMIVGHYVSRDSSGNWGQTHGYILDNGDFISFDVPGSTLTMGYDLNPAGDIVVGTHQDAQSRLFHTKECTGFFEVMMAYSDR